MLIYVKLRKELSLCFKLSFSNPYISLQPNVVKSVGSNNLSLNYQRLTPLDCKDKVIRKFKFFSLDPISFSTFKIRFKLKFTWVLTFHRNFLKHKLKWKENQFFNSKQKSNKYIFSQL